MAQNRRTHLAGENKVSSLQPKHLTKQEFGRRLYTAMLGKGWTQAELARQADVLRDSISNYVRGNNLPEPVNLRKIAKALDMEAEELLPNYTEAAIEDDIPSLELKVSTNDPSTSWLRVNRAVSTKTAAEIIKILNDDVANGN